MRASAAQLAGLVRRIGRAGDRFLVLQRVPDLPDVFAQVWHEAGGDYAVEHRDAAVDRHFEARTDRLDAVIAALTGWARGDVGWDGGLSWSRVHFGPARQVPPLDLGETELGELENRVREVLAGGYATRAELAELAEDHLVTADRRPVSREQAQVLADRLWLERVAERPRGGARPIPNGSRSCGQAEIGSEAAPSARGFVYFHAQGTESAAAGHGLTLLYGGFDGSSETTAAIGHEVVAALEAACLHTTWNRDPGQAITVTPLDWRRRLVG
ncbi:DUF6891 domain-containing protein [Lentzea sp. NPDC004789]